MSNNAACLRGPHPKEADCVQLVVSLVHLEVCSEVILDSRLLLVIQRVQQPLVRCVELVSCPRIHPLNFAPYSRQMTQTNITTADKADKTARKSFFMHLILNHTEE
jgi:hypothetical protein